MNGPSSGGDGAFDYDGSATVSGGTVLMAGSTGMAQSFTSGSQAFAMVQASGQAGSTIQVTDGNGNVVATLTATKSFGCVLASGSSIAEGSTVTVTVDGTSYTGTATTSGTAGIMFNGTSDNAAPGAAGGNQGGGMQAPSGSGQANNTQTASSNII